MRSAVAIRVRYKTRWGFEFLRFRMTKWRKGRRTRLNRATGCRKACEFESHLSPSSSGGIARRTIGDNGRTLILHEAHCNHVGDRQCKLMKVSSPTRGSYVGWNPILTILKKFSENAPLHKTGASVAFLNESCRVANRVWDNRVLAEYGR